MKKLNKNCLFFMQSKNFVNEIVWYLNVVQLRKNIQVTVHKEKARWKERIKNE